MGKPTIPSTDEAWEERTLGADEAYVKVDDSATEVEIDEASGTQLVSIRMQKAMIEDLKLIGAINGGLGYQTLMKQILQRFIDSEKKKIWNDVMAEKMKEIKASASDGCEKPKHKPQRKAA